MRRILETNPESTSALVARLFLAVVVFPHGAQKMLGWFGGNGFPGSINFLTQGAGLPWIIGFLELIIEFFAPLFLVPGFLTRVAAFAIGVEFTGVVLKAHINNGFFMNWAGTQKGEGIEYFIILLGVALALIIAGGGKASVDAALVKSN